ncbi:MAG: aldo/keto reductase [Lachnospiraceae bacterium]|nr:aldo/keto reductase [Lachnospiraceae bacterium]
MDFKPKKKLGFGLMRMPLLDPSDEASVDVEQVCRMVDVFLERGFTYFDTAWMYHDFNSENVVKTALVDRYPRDSFTIATKLHGEYIKTREDRDKIFYEQMRKTGVDFFDYYLIHGIDAELLEIYEELDCFHWLLEKKEAGLVRHAGFSFHDTPELLDEILTKHPEMEFVQLMINYLDWESEWVQSRACYEVAVKHGKPVTVMEPVRGGTLARLPEDVEKLFTQQDPEMSAPSWAIRFVASLDDVMVVLSGMSSMEQMEDNTSYMADFKPLSEDEKNLCLKAGKMIISKLAIPCTACSYCTSGCPMKIAIPKYFKMYNDNTFDDLEVSEWSVKYSDYPQLLSGEGGKATDCLACGQCEGVCPQHLPIIENLRKIAEHIEE